MILTSPHGIAGRLYAIAGLTLSAVVALAATSIYFAGATGRAAQVLYAGSLIGVVEAAELELLLEKHRRVIESAPVEFDRAQLRKDKRSAEEIQAQIERLVQRSAPTFASHFASSLPELVQHSRDVLHLADNFAQDKALQAVDQYAASASRLQDKIRSYRSERLDVAGTEAAILVRNGRLLVQWVALIAVAAVLLIGPLSLILTRRLAVRLKNITEAMAKLARNDTAVTVNATADIDEIGEMSRAVEVFKANAITLLDQKASLEKLNLWLDIALNNMARGLSLFDANQRLVVCNANYALMYDLPAEMTRPGTRFDQILERRIPLIHASEPASSQGMPVDVKETVILAVTRRLASRFSQRFVDGRIVEVSVKPLEAGGWLALHEDVTEQRLATESITRLARQDSLTGLANRLLFREALDQAWHDNGPGCGFALLCIDLDKFKEVNDAHGHPIGDALLAAVARRLEETARRGDLVARLGGDEFAIIQAGTLTRADAEALAHRLIEAIAAAFQIQGHRVEIGATVGIALAPEDARNSDELLRNADMALYRAKAEGRGTFRFFDPAMEGRIRARRSLEIDLQRALGAGQLELYYQPIVSLERKAIAGCEALIRWRHPTLGMVSPADFIPLAEATGLINSIGEWALKTACKAAADWPADVRVAVNLSVAQFAGPDLVQIASSALAASGLAPTRLELEVTESLLLDDNPATLELLHRLRQLGVRIALDDFGTGYSSLSYLRSFPFDKIKIDQTFVRDLTQRKDCVAIVGAVAQLACSLDMATVAEGVETEDHLERVRTAGCTEVQGYLFSRPVPASEITKVMADCNRRLARAGSPEREPGSALPKCA